MVEKLSLFQFKENEISEILNDAKTIVERNRFISLRFTSLQNQDTMKYIEKFSDLEELYLNFCNLTSLPSEFKKLQRLKLLDISGNKFLEIPKILRELPNLETLVMRGNDSDGISITGLQYIINISVLDLGETKISIKDCPEFPKLVELNLSSTGIKDISNICKIKSLEVLYLNMLFLTFLPETIGNLSNLTYLELCFEEGIKFPESFKNLVNLKELIVFGASNFIMPEFFAELQQLERLDFIECNQVKNLPTNIGKLTHLKIIDIEDSEIQKIPESICNCLNLEKLNLSYGTIKSLPKNFSKLINLRELDLSHNQIQELPVNFGKLKKLEKLSLGDNLIERLPEDFGELTNLTYLNLEYMPKLIYYPKSFTNLVNLKRLIFSSGDYEKPFWLIEFLNKFEDI